VWGIISFQCIAVVLIQDGESDRLSPSNEALHIAYFVTVPCIILSFVNILEKGMAVSGVGCNKSY
jgi:hypothetical protein